MSRHFRLTLAIIGTLVVLGTTAIAVMSTPWFRRALERRLIAGLEEVTGGRVEVQEFRFHPLVLQAVFHGLVLHGSEAPQAPPLFSARIVAVRLSLANLLHREVRIRNLDWDGAEVHLTTNADGSTNLPGPVTRCSAGQIMEQLVDLRMGRVTLARSRFFWNNRTLDIDLSARDVALLLRLHRGSGYEGSLVASDLAATKPGAPMPALTFSSRFTLGRNELVVTSLSWQARGMTGQGSFTFHPTPEPEAYFSFQTSSDAAALTSLLRLPDLRNGNLNLEGQGIYRHGEISAHGRFQARQMLLRNAQFNSGPLEVSADYSLGQSRLAVSNLKVLAWGGSALGECQAVLDGPTPEFQVRARLRDMNLTALLQSSTNRPLLIAQLRPASIIDGALGLTWSGRFEGVKSQFDVHFTPPAVPSPGFLPISGDMQGSLETNHGFAVSLEDSKFHTPFSSFSAKGTLLESMASGETSARLQIQLETSQLEEWQPVLAELLSSAPHPPISLESPATLVGEISGPIRNPEVRGSVRMGRFEFRDWTWDAFQADFAASPDLLQVSSGRLSHGSSVLTLEALAQLNDWRITRSSQIRVSAHAQQTPLEGLKAALGVDYPLAGSISGRITLAGTASKLAGTGDVRIGDVSLAGETFDSFSTSIRVGESTWDLSAIELVKGHGRVTGKAQVDPSTRSLTCQLHGSGLSLADFKKLAGASPSLSPSNSLEGQASFDLQGSGTADHFLFHATSLLHAARIGGTPLGDLYFQLEGKDRNLQFRGISSGSTGIFSMSGDAQTVGDWPLQLQGQFVSYRLDPLARLWLNSNFDAQVIASGSFKASGPLRDLSQFEMQSQVDTLEVSFPSLKWRNEKPVEVRFASKRFSAQPFRMQGPATNLTVEGSLDLAGPASLSVSAQGIADATLLSLLDPTLQTSGQSRIKVRASGPPSRPQLNGVMEIEDVSLARRGLPLRLSNLNGEIQLEGERATVKSLRGLSGGGTVTFDGFVTLASPTRAELTAKLDQVRVRYPLDFTSTLSGTLRWAGTSERSQLRGELAVSQVVSSDNKPWLEQLTQPASPFGDSGTAESSPLADSVRLNVRVSSPTPVRLNVQDLHLTADIDVHLQGSLGNPVEVGAVHFLNGEAIFRGNRFTLDRGDLNLTNPVRTQATLDLEARTRVQQYDLTVDISGPLGRLKMTYRSDPPLPTGDVLSLLALGYARQQQEASASGLVSSFTAGNPLQSVGESALLSQALSSQVGGRIQRLFGVSRIQIDPNVGLPGLNNGERVTVEQQVTKDLTLTYITNTASSQYQIVQFEWAVGENLSLIGVRDPNGIVGVELRFRRRFK